jgi:cation diffusion facilitator family transporter
MGAVPTGIAGIEARLLRGRRAAQAGVLANVGLALVKLFAGILGNSYALIADAIESAFDVLGSLVLWGGLRIAGKEPDPDFPFGYGKAEPLAAAVVSLLLLGAGVGVAIQAAREIVTPHHLPAPFTLVVLVAVIATKEVLYRRVIRVGRDVGSHAVRTDAWHHRSDALTSFAALVGIGVAVLGGPGWEEADDWAALVASGVILANAVRLLRPAVWDLMDRTPRDGTADRITVAARSVPGVLATEKLKVRRSGLGLYVDLHVQADPALSLYEAHVLSGRVKTAVRAAVPSVVGVLVHMEPYEGAAL